MEGPVHLSHVLAVSTLFFVISALKAGTSLKGIQVQVFRVTKS